MKSFPIQRYSPKKSHSKMVDFAKNSVSSHLMIAVLCAVALLPGPFQLMAEDYQYTLNGTISDPSDNLLPNVRVALKLAGVSTQTDGNGNFSLTIK